MRVPINGSHRISIVSTGSDNELSTEEFLESSHTPDEGSAANKQGGHCQQKFNLSCISEYTDRLTPAQPACVHNY